MSHEVKSFGDGFGAKDDNKNDEMVDENYDDDEEELAASDEDEVSELPAVQNLQLNPRPLSGFRRCSVSAEVDASTTHTKTRTFHPKSPEQIQRLNATLNKNFLFASLSADQKKELVDAMVEVKVNPGQDVIRQYDDGDFFYVIDSGVYDVYKRANKTDEKESKIFQYDGAGSFGELALMYNCPRAATVRAVSSGSLWQLDRASFRKIIIESTRKQRALYENFLEKVPLLANLSTGERAQVSDALAPLTFYDGEYIIKQGEKGDSFYLLESGEAVCLQTAPGKSDKQEVGRIKPGGYFGERALITQEPRACDVVAVGETKVAVMDRPAFERLLGDIKQIMERVISSYTSAH